MIRVTIIKIKNNKVQGKDQPYFEEGQTWTGVAPSLPVPGQKFIVYGDPLGIGLDMQTLITTEVLLYDAENKVFSTRNSMYRIK